MSVNMLSTVLVEQVVQQILCAQRMYLLKLLRHQGLPDAQLSVIANAVIISSFVCPPCMGGFLCVELVNRINAFSRRLQRFGYLQCRMTVAELMNTSSHMICFVSYVHQRML